MCADAQTSGAPPTVAPHLTLLIGGVRSGKSARAVDLARETPAGGRVLFVATAQAFDDDMARRIAAHRAERPSTWDTLESPLDLPAELARALAAAEAASAPYATVAIDCLTLWVSNVLLALDEADDAERTIAGHVARLLAVRDGDGRASRSPRPRWIVVTNEVGLGVVPPTPLGRRYRDALGRANRMVAAAADEVTLMVAGLELPLKPPRAP
jgi:adenosyl cobinamide kinase/adenosyl cobinamide phosphate guanylyltransferase